MWKALLKKQFLELNQYYFQNRKTGKNRGKAGTVAFIALFAVIFIGLGFCFYMMSAPLAVTLESAGYGWLFFALMGLISMALGVFGSVFNTYAGLYHAKDNELLLSMPIPPSKILLVRMVGVYAMGLLYGSLVFIPAILAWWFNATAVTVLTVVLDVLLIFVLALLVLTLTCLLGWVVALISSRLKNKSFITVICSLAFIAIYYFVYFKASNFLSNILTYADTTAAALRRWAYPMYAFGRGGTGDVVGFLVFTLLAVALFALCWLLMSRSFLKITTTNRGEKKTEYREQMAKVTNLSAALVRKEWLHFKSSPTYMMNCGLGVVLLPVAAVVLLVKADSLRTSLTGLLAQMPDASAFVPVIAAAAVGLISSLNCVTAPSVSLEGKTIWVLQTMPIDPWQVLWAKLRLHLRISAVPALIAAAAVCIVLQMKIYLAVYVIVLSLLFVMASGCFGLVMNLLKPNLSWTSEVVPVKQGASVVLTMFGGWFLAAAMVGIFFLIHKFVSTEAYLLLCIAVMALAIRVMDAWLRKRGAEIFAELQA